MTTDPSPAPEGEPSEHPEADGPTLPDDVWDRFLNDTERDIRSSAPKEPSARARIVARRLREEDQRAAPRERRGPVRGRAAGAPTAWRGGATDAGRRMSARRRILRSTVGTVLVVLFVLVLLAPGSAWSLLRGHGWHNGHRPAPAPTGPASGTPGATGQPTERPFAV